MRCSPLASSISPSWVSSRSFASLRMNSVSISNFAMEKRSRIKSVCQPARQRLKGEKIALGAEPGDHADRGRTYIGAVAEAFTLVDVGKMDLDGRQLGSVQGVQQGHRRMGIGAGVDDDAAVLVARRLNEVDQHP